jgi:hypothetical protein
VKAAWLVMAALMAGPSAAAAQGADDLGAYERQALGHALEARGLALDPEPGGKVVGRIHVVNLDVFSPRDGFLQMFNFFHVTTHEDVIEREVLLRPGESFDPAIIEETRRKLSDPLYTTLVVIVPVINPAPGNVDLLVVTRDIWSLRLNTNYEIQETTLSLLSFSISENNVLGRRKTAAIAFSMDLGDYFVGPLYIDKNIAGTRLQLSTNAGAIFARADSAFEGTRSSTTLAYPLWSLRTPWGASLSVSHFDAKVRLFRGLDLDVYDNPDTPEVEAVPHLYDLRLFNTTVSVQRQLLYGDIVQRVTGGHRLASVRPSVPEGQVDDPVLLEAFISDRLPRSERSSALFLDYFVFLNRFAVLRNVDSFELPEDLRLGPTFNVEVSSAMKFIGSERDFLRGISTVSYAHALPGDGLARAAASVSGRLEGGELIDNVASGAVTAASPAIGGAVRFVGEAAVAALINETNNSFFALGGNNGLRGYAINQFTGERRVRGNLEVRTLPFKILFARFGAVAFYDVGHAADEWSDIVLHHDVGVGLRTLTPQLQPFVFRFDYAIPLTGDTAGLPGRFIAGIRQAF